MIERIGAKGFLFSVIQVGTETMNVINTHLYAGYDAYSELRRKEQIEFMDGILKTIPEYRLFPTIFAGDLNAQHPDMACSAVYDYVATEMGFTDSKPHIDRNDLTSDASANDYISKKEIPSKLDYIFIKSSEVASLRVVKSGRCFSSSKPVSDHFGWSALLSINVMTPRKPAEWASRL
jgi:endonuclease/exonuclease/phosphatase family metal-dependent hydrolase